MILHLYFQEENMEAEVGAECRLNCCLQACLTSSSPLTEPLNLAERCYSLAFHTLTRVKVTDVHSRPFNWLSWCLTGFN